MSPVAAVASATENLNIKLVHSTRQNSPTDPIYFAFSYTGEDGIEEILTAEVAGPDLFTLMQENGWLAKVPAGRKMALAARRAG
jgi:hypothetical protein